MLFKHKKAVIYRLIILVAFCFAMAAWGGWGSRSSWLNSAGLLLDVLGLAQLEIGGVFAGIYEYLQRADEEDRPLPSRHVREVVHPDDEPMVFWHWLFTNPATGVQIIVAGCLVQLVANWV